MGKEKIARSIEVFDNNSEWLVNEYPIDHIPLDELWKICNCPEDDPELCDEYPIETVDQRLFLLRYVNVEFDLEKYSYFISSGAINS